MNYISTDGKIQGIQNAITIYQNRIKAFELNISNLEIERLKHIYTNKLYMPLKKLYRDYKDKEYVDFTSISVMNTEGDEITITSDFLRLYVKKHYIQIFDKSYSGRIDLDTGICDRYVIGILDTINIIGITGYTLQESNSEE